MKMAAHPEVDNALALELYERMQLIRQFELKASEVCKKGEISSYLHLYIGEEATGVGVCSCLEPSDFITSTHRGHGHALAKGCSPDRMMAELYGRVDGLSGGRGGSMHIFDASVGLLGTNGFVAGGIPSAVGAAIASKTKNTGAVAVAFFGDGAVSHGSFHESVNLASTLNLPVVFVCENNLYATHTPFCVATKNTNVASRGAAYGLPGVSVDGQDVLAVRAVAADAVKRARNGEGPTLIESKTYRYVGHHEGDPPAGAYRTIEEVKEWKKRDPLILMERYLEGQIEDYAAKIDCIRDRVTSIVDRAVEFARSSEWPSGDSLTNHLYCEAK
jgi:2-oxoisovalerate dehydrogenase E1 component